MKIQSVEITNYKAFLGTHTLKFGGKNVFIYGENGSGKSSLYYALKDFFQSSVENTDFMALENIFIEESDKGTGKIKVKLKPAGGKSCDQKEYHVSSSGHDHGEASDTLVRDANKLKSFLTYKHLLDISACALFLGKLIPNLFDQLHMTALDMMVRNERWELSQLQDPEGKRFHDEIFDDEIMDIQDEKRYWNIDMEITCRNDRLKEYNDFGRVPDWVKAYIFAKENNIKNRELFVEKYSKRFDTERDKETHKEIDPNVCDDDINIPF